MTKVLPIAEKYLKETLRQPKVLAISLGLPVVFLAIFSFAFGGDQGNDTYALGVVNQDEGTLGADYLAALGNATYDDSETPLVRLVAYASREDAQRGVREREVGGMLVVPPGFTEGLTPTEVQQPGAVPVLPGQGGRGPPTGTSVELSGDPSFSEFGALTSIVEAFTRAFAEQASGQPTPVTVEHSVITSRELTPFDFIAPGLMVFAILNLVPAAASALARESESGTLDRVRQSPTGALQLLTGVTLAQMAIASISMALMMLAAVLLGFHSQGSYLLAYLVALGAAVGSVGIGMIIAAFSAKQDEAANIAALVSVPASFLSGSFFALPEVRLFSLGGRDVGLYDFLPTTHAVDALRQVLTFGQGAEDVVFSLVALVALGALFLLVGAVLYKRNRLAPA